MLRLPDVSNFITEKDILSEFGFNLSFIDLSPYSREPFNLAKLIKFKVAIVVGFKPTIPLQSSSVNQSYHLLATTFYPADACLTTSEFKTLKLF